MTTCILDVQREADLCASDEGRRVLLVRLPEQRDDILLSSRQDLAPFVFQFITLASMTRCRSRTVSVSSINTFTKSDSHS